MFFLQLLVKEFTKQMEECAMFVNQSAQLYNRPMLPSFMRQKWHQRFRQQMRQKVLAYLGSKVMLVAVGKVALVFCPLLLLVVFCLSSAAEKNVATILAAEEGYSQLMDENIKLRAERARLYSPEYLDKKAAKQLSLYAPEKRQVARL